MLINVYPYIYFSSFILFKQQRFSNQAIKDFIKLPFKSLSKSISPSWLYGRPSRIRFAVFHEDYQMIASVLSPVGILDNKTDFKWIYMIVTVVITV